MPVAGVLLALDLLFLPWHHFSLNLERFGVGLTGTVTINRTGVQPPKASLGILALVLALALVVYAAADGVARSRLAPTARFYWDRFPAVAGPFVLVLLLFKLGLDADFIGIGAWLALVCGLALAYGGFTIGRDALLAQGAGGDAGLSNLTQQQKRWLLLSGIIVLGIVAAPLVAETKDDIPIPDVVANAPGSSAASAPATTVAGEGNPSNETTSPHATGSGGPTTLPRSAQGETTVDPTTVDPGSAITVGGTGAEPGQPYVLKLDRVAARCPTSSTLLGGARVAAENGTLAETEVFIPTTTTSGRYYVCFVNPSDTTKSTAPVELAVT
jgi:hypothetical protein